MEPNHRECTQSAREGTRLRTRRRHAGIPARLWPDQPVAHVRRMPAGHCSQVSQAVGWRVVGSLARTCGWVWSGRAPTCHSRTSNKARAWEEGRCGSPPLDTPPFPNGPPPSHWADCMPRARAHLQPEAQRVEGVVGRAHVQRDRNGAPAEPSRGEDHLQQLAQLRATAELPQVGDGGRIVRARRPPGVPELQRGCRLQYLVLRCGGRALGLSRGRGVGSKVEGVGGWEVGGGGSAARLVGAF